MSIHSHVCSARFVKDSKPENDQIDKLLVFLQNRFVKCLACLWPVLTPVKIDLTHKVCLVNGTVLLGVLINTQYNILTMLFILSVVVLLVISTVSTNRRIKMSDLSL